VVRAAKAQALLSGRDYVAPDDVQAFYFPTYEQQATATAAGIRSYKATTSTAYSVAMSGMPKFRNAIEMMAYAVFPIVVIMIVVAGQYAGTFLKGYLGTLLWVQLWPPLYAVMNYMMNIKSKSAIGSMMQIVRRASDVSTMRL
jgi:hypothetical protein